MINNDQELIDRFVAWSEQNGLSHSATARIVGRTRAWASFLIHGKIHRLRSNTRSRIKEILGNR